MSNQELAEELHKPIIIKFEKRKVNLPFIDNVSGADLADTQLISKFNKRIRFFICVIDIFSKHVWVIPLKGKKKVFHSLMLFKKSLINLIADQIKYG